MKNYEIKGLKFEWDDEKAALNYINHGVKFETAAKVFFDDNKLVRLDEEHLEEERYNILGKAGSVLFVVVTLRSADVIRLISARKASKFEKERYEYGRG